MTLSLFRNICQTYKVRQSIFQRDSGLDFAYSVSLLLGLMNGSDYILILENISQ